MTIDIADDEARSDAAAELAPQVLAVLREWRRSGQALSRDWLSDRFRCNERIVREAMVELRRQGHPVIADPDGGYRLAHTAQEVRTYSATLKSRISALREVVEALDRAAMALDDEPLQPALLCG